MPHAEKSTQISAKGLSMPFSAKKLRSAANAVRESFQLVRLARNEEIPAHFFKMGGVSFWCSFNLLNPVTNLYYAVSGNFAIYSPILFN